MIVTDTLKQLPRNWYHGTSSLHHDSLNEGVKIKLPRVRTTTDFGAGFYLTSNWNQAYEWAKACCKREQSENPDKEIEPLVFEYELDTDAFDSMENRIFGDHTLDWACFVLYNRKVIDLTAPLLLDFEDSGLQEYYQQIAATYEDFSPPNCVYGPMADGTKGKKLRLLLEGVRAGKIGIEEFLKSSVYKRDRFPISHQFSINSQDALKYMRQKGVFNIESGKWWNSTKAKEAKEAQ